MFGDKITQSVSEAVKKVLATEKLHPNQQKLDVHEPEKDKLTKKDFEMLRSNKKPKNEAFDPLKHVKNPSPAVKTAAKDVKRGSYADRAALMKAGGVKDDRGPRGVTKEEVEEAVESPFTSYKKPREIESRGGSGIKLGSRYGGGKQKDEPTQDEAPKTKKPKGKMVEQTFTGQGSSPDLNMASDIAKMKAKNDAMRHVYGDNFKDKKMVPHTVGKMDMTQDGKNYVVKSPLTLNNPPDKEKDRLGESNRLMNFKEMFGE